MDKSTYRSRLASLSFSEKIKILEKLRDRDKAIAAAGLRKKKAPPKREFDPKIDNQPSKD